MADQKEEETRDSKVQRTQRKSSNEHSGARPSFEKGKEIERLLNKRRNKARELCQYGVNKDEDAQKGCAGLNVFSMQCRIEDTKFQGEVKEKKEEDVSLKGSKEIEEENAVLKDSYKEENIELKRRLDSYQKKITELQEIVIDSKNENTELREELASCKKKLGRRHSLADVLKPEPPKDGTPRKSNPARHRRHKTVPPISLTGRKVETKDQAAQVSPSECNCPLPSITLSRSTAHQIRCLPDSMVVNVSLPTHLHAILTAAPYPPIQSSGTAGVSTEN